MPGPLTIYVGKKDDEIYEAAKAEADRQGISLSQFIWDSVYFMVRDQLPEKK